MVKVGVHVSIAGSLDLAVDRAKDAGCDVFQMFSRNPRGWAYKPFTDEDADTVPVEDEDHRHHPGRPHALPAEPCLAQAGDLRRSRSPPSPRSWTAAAGSSIPYLVTHLGHHLGDGIAGGRMRVIKAISDGARRI